MSPVVSARFQSASHPRLGSYEWFVQDGYSKWSSEMEDIYGLHSPNHIHSWRSGEHRFTRRMGSKKSTDRLRTHKPDPKAYQFGVDALHLKRGEILFVPFASWDLSGARWFGYPTSWVNRSGAPQ